MIPFSDDTITAIEFLIEWQKDGISHKDWFLGRKINPVNDIFPRDMRKALEGKREGERVTIHYEPRMCIPRFKQSLVITRTLDKLRPKTVDGRKIIPCVGRFYPQGHINGLLDIYPDTITPFRLIKLDKTHFVADRNHPLATIPITITATLQAIEKRDTGTYGSISHWRESTCDWGPGMQAMYEGTPTQFDEPGFFKTQASNTPCTPPPPDFNARYRLQATYDSLMKHGTRRFDITMDGLEPRGTYDAISFTQSIEYCTDPVATLKKYAAHIPQGGTVLIGFTNQFDSAHVTNGWKYLHPFERMGLVLDFLRQAGLDTNMSTCSFRNDWRDPDEPDFIQKKGISDPVFVVCGHKK